MNPSAVWTVTRLTCLLFGIALIPATARAGGLSLYEIATSDVGLASFGLGAEWQASPTLSVAFSYELAYGGDLPVNQNRGPLAGALVGEFPNSYVNFFQVSFIWGSGDRKQGNGTT